MFSNVPAWVLALVVLALLVPIGVYLLIIAHVGAGAATWKVRLIRPPLLMLLLTPGVSVGHGIGVGPMLAGLLSPSAGDRVLNAVSWLIFSICGFLAELWVARRRVRQAHEARQRIEQRERTDALKDLGRNTSG